LKAALTRRAEDLSAGVKPADFLRISCLTASRPNPKVCDAARQGGDTDVTDATPIRKTRRRALTALAAASFGFAGAVGGQPPSPPGHPSPGGQSLAPGSNAPFLTQLPQKRQLTLGEAIAIAQNRYPGRVVRAQTIQQGNGAVHEIRIIGNDGRVHTVTVDARTGAVH
jgi:hypothetical protein